MHITCCAYAYQLLCKRTTAVVRPKIQTASTTYPISSNNIFLLFQQQEKGESLIYDTSSAEPAKVKSGEEWVKSVQELFTPRNAHKHWGFRRKGEE